MTRERIRDGALLALPILALFLWLLLIEFRVQTGTQARIRVAGYDPRDLLTGHYLRFSIPAPTPEQTSSSLEKDGAACLCIQAPHGTALSSAGPLLACEDIARASRPDCVVYLKGSYAPYSGFRSHIERYSIPERYAPVLSVAPEDSSILLSLTPDGQGTVLQFFVGDEKLEEYAERMLIESNARTHPETSPLP